MRTKQMFFLIGLAIASIINGQELTQYNEFNSSSVTWEAVASGSDHQLPLHGLVPPVLLPDGSEFFASTRSQDATTEAGPFLVRNLKPEMILQKRKHENGGVIMNKENFFPFGALYGMPPIWGTDFQQDLRVMKEHNFNILRVAMPWASIEISPDKYDFSLFDELFSKANEYGIKIIPHFDTHPPKWIAQTLTEGVPVVFGVPTCQDQPNLNKGLTKYISAVVNRYKDNPALYAWILRNEPHPHLCFCQYTIKKYREWLKEKYGTIEALNQVWRSNTVSTTSRTISMGKYSNFEEIEPPRLEPWEWGNPTAWIDWRAFSCDNFTDHLKWISDVVKELDPIHPTQGNVGGSRAVSLWDIAKNVDITGISNYNYEPSLFSYKTDLIRSSTKNGIYWISEMQGGPSKRFAPSGKDVAIHAWQAVGRGAKGIFYWSWRPRLWGRENGEFGLCMMDGTPTERVQEAGKVADIINSHSDIFSKSTIVPSEVAIFYSLPNQLLSYGEKKENLANEEALKGCYRALWKQNIQADFVTPEEIKEGILDKYRVLYLPFAYAMSAQTGEKIKEFVNNGGSVFADAQCAVKDEHGLSYLITPGAGLDELFGCRVKDFLYCQRVSIQVVEAVSDISLGSGDILTGNLIEERLENINGQVVGIFEDGNPAIISRKFGKGQAMIVGTHMAESYFKYGESSTGNLISGFARSAGVKPPVKISGGDKMECMMLENDNHKVVIIINHQEQQVVAKLEIKGDFREVEELTLGETPAYSAKGAITDIYSDIGPKEVKVYLLTDR